MALEATQKAIRANIHINTRVIEIADFKSEVNFDLWGRLEASMASDATQWLLYQYIHLYQSN